MSPYPPRLRMRGIMGGMHSVLRRPEATDRPGYGMLGRLFAIGYIRGLEHAAYGHPSTRLAASDA